MIGRAAYSTSLIPKPDGIEKKIFGVKEFNTSNIIKVIMLCHQNHKTEIDKFGKTLKGRTTEQTMRNIYRFVHDKIRYKKDAYLTEVIKSPQVLWETKIGDCKSFSLFVAAILESLGYDYTLRLAAYEGKRIQHIYVVAHTEDGDYILDATLSDFNDEKPPSYIQDYNSNGELIYSGGVGNIGLGGAIILNGIFTLSLAYLAFRLLQKTQKQNK